MPEETPPKALLQVIDSLCPAIVLRGFRVGLADSTGTLQTQYTFEPFGNTTVTGASTTNSFAYTGRELDATGLYFYRARYYNPTVQRFISEDPIGFSGGDVNLYAYTGNSPTNLRDPSGKIAPLVVGGVLCGTGAAIGGYYYYKSQQTAGRKTTFGGYAKSALAGCEGGLLAGLGIGVALEAAVPGIALAGGEGVFYSGLGAAGGDLASAYAAETGAASISETFAGTALNAVDSVTSALGAEGSLVGPAWEFFSAQFAEGAGSAVALVGEGISAAGTYATVELPILLNNGVIPFLLWP